MKQGEVATDAEIILAAAKRVLETADPAGAAAGKYTVNISGGKVGAVGDNAEVYMGNDGA